MKNYLIFAFAAFTCLSNASVYGQATATRLEVSETACPLEVISVPTPDNHKAAAVVRKPPGKGPNPAIVFLHGGLGQQGAKRLNEEAQSMPTLLRFLAAGYVTVNATFRGRSEDPQTRDALVDCLAVIDHVKKMPEVDPKSVLVFGGSGGGSLALELAGETELCAIVAGEPASILFTGMLNKENVKDRQKGEEMMDDPKRFYTPELEKLTQQKIRKINCPILIVHGDQHAINKINHEIIIPELKKAEKQVEVTLYPGQPHGFYNGQVTRTRSPEAVLKCFADCNAFFKKHLATQPTPLGESLVKQVPAGRQ